LISGLGLRMLGCMLARAAGVWVLVVFVSFPPQASAAGDAERGRMIFALAGGCGCHTPEGGPVGAGGRELPTPFGTFYGTNITPDPETGIGTWTDAEIAAAIRDGNARGKGVEAPVMPYYLYAGMSEGDVADLVAFLRTLEPVRRPNRDHDVAIPLPRLVYRAWRFLFAPSATRPAATPTALGERGRYWADHVAICRDCHTPRNRFGGPRHGLYLAGAEKGPDGRPVPNITPDATGVGDWDVDDLTQVLKSGMMPNFDNVQGLMAEVVEGYGGGPGYSQAPEEELRAIATYLKTVPPIEHEVGTD
jgi:mono/diheme cytochrome c family protein